MILFSKKLAAIEKRILEINKELCCSDISIVEERDRLEEERSFIRDKRQVRINVLTISVSLFIAFSVPLFQQYITRVSEEHSNIQSLYKSIVANGDIFIDDHGSIQFANNNGITPPVPGLFLEYDIDSRSQKVLQKKLGISQYMYLLYYINLTKLLNRQIDLINEDFIMGTTSTRLADTKIFFSTLTELDSGDWQTSRFNYIYDTSCLEYLLSKSFSYIDVAERDKKVRCNSDSLNRLFYHYGYIPTETPKWILPDLKAALNEREPGLGDREINKYYENLAF